MQIVGFMEDEMQSVLELVAAVLKLGNIEFKPESRCNGTDESRIKDKNGVFKCACVEIKELSLDHKSISKYPLSNFALLICPHAADS